tara:strand:+ start:762 stop:1070 length:309 start_codon:yes stop_codon:yes gene_type:complete
MESNQSRKGPYALDSQLVRHRTVITKTIVNTPKFDDMLLDLGKAYEYEVGYVPAGYEHRPDLISNVFYGTPKNWWLLMLVNGISDPFEGFTQNQRILIPIMR